MLVEYPSSPDGYSFYLCFIFAYFFEFIVLEFYLILLWSVHKDAEKVHDAQLDEEYSYTQPPLYSTLPESDDIIGNRTVLGRGRPKCGRIKQVSSNNKNYIMKKGSLADNNPDIGQEWHPFKNGSLKPSQVTIIAKMINEEAFPECERNSLDDMYASDIEYIKADRSRVVGTVFCAAAVPEPRSAK